MTVLAIGGYAYAGKDALVDALEELYSYERTFMSKPLMNALLLLDPVIPITLLENLAIFNQEHVKYSLLHEIVGYTDSKNEPEVRRLLQILGTEIGRNMFGVNAWVDQVAAEIETSKDELWAVTGVRYRNELETFQDNFTSVSVWIHRPGITPVNSHSSDNSLGPEDFDIQVHNSGSLEDLKMTALELHDTHVADAHHKRSDQPLFTPTK